MCWSITVWRLCFFCPSTLKKIEVVEVSTICGCSQCWICLGCLCDIFGMSSIVFFLKPASDFRGITEAWDDVYQMWSETTLRILESELVKQSSSNILETPKPRFLEVFMVNNLVFRWPKPLFFMVLGAHGWHWNIRQLRTSSSFF